MRLNKGKQHKLVKEKAHFHKTTSLGRINEEASFYFQACYADANVYEYYVYGSYQGVYHEPENKF